MIDFNEIEYASYTDVGIRRSHNQDSHAVKPATDDEHWRQVGHVFLVADGMGGHAVGELASKLAADNIPHIFSKYTQNGPRTALERAFNETNATIHTRGKQNRDFEGMGTTGIALVLRPEGAWVGHVGDSRAYRIRNGLIEQLSFDHSWLWELARRQHKHPDELIGIPANRILRSLGPEAVVQVDVEGPYPLERGDVFMLCSDGLSGQVNDRVIGAVATALPPDEAVRFLVHMANLQGGPDNTTVILVRVGGEPIGKSPQSHAEVVFPIGELGSDAGMFTLMRQHLNRLPWAFFLLLMSIVMAGIAILMAALGLNHALYVFFGAGVLLLAGIVTLMVQNYREGRKPPEGELEPRPLQVYRQIACPLDADMYQKLLEAARSLEENIKNKQWEYEVNSFQDYTRQAAQYFKQERLREAFRELCRAMLVLMEAVHRYRGKNEDFKPLW